MSKFKPGDKFTLGPIQGKVVNLYPTSDAISVKIDFNTASKTDPTPWVNRFNTTWFESVAEPVGPTAFDVLDAMQPGDMFTWLTASGSPYAATADQVFVLIKATEEGATRRKVDIVDLHAGQTRRGYIAYPSDKITKVIEE